MTQYRGFKRPRYASVNKRIRNLEELGYVTKAASKETKAGFEASLYELRVAAHLALVINSIDLSSLLPQMSESIGLTILGALMDAVKTDEAA